MCCASRILVTSSRSAAISDLHSTAGLSDSAVAASRSDRRDCGSRLEDVCVNTVASCGDDGPRAVTAASVPTSRVVISGEGWGSGNGLIACGFCD